MECLNQKLHLKINPCKFTPLLGFEPRLQVLITIVKHISYFKWLNIEEAIQEKRQSILSNKNTNLERKECDRILWPAHLQIMNL